MSPQRLGAEFAGFGLGWCSLATEMQPSSVYGSNRVILSP